MQLSNGRLVFSPSDLNAFLACPHLTSLQVAVARGELAKPFRHNPHADLIRRKGEEWEAAYLAHVRAEGRTIVEPADAAATEAALRGGADVVYQAILTDGRWLGKADFVERQADGSYEVVDTKLARHARPAHVLQLCFYSEQVARITGRAPKAMHVVAGTGERESFPPDEFAAYYRRTRERFLAVVGNGRATYPYPVEHCSLCEFLPRCEEQWERDDHLTLVAGVSRLQHDRLVAGSIHTMEALGAAPPDTRVSKIRPKTFDTLRHQAELQVHRRHTGEHRVDLLAPEADRGFALMPEPNHGDMWLDLEGHPWFEPARGLEFLFGWVELDEAGAPMYRCFWAHDRAGERRALEALVDYVAERRRRFPGMHVYHYAAYERSALSRLAGEHATREAEVDDVLRGEVLVDLYRVTRQALRASVPSYSIKKVEELYGFRRTAEVSGGTESVEAFEAWLDTGDEALLEGIRLYNEEDCLSTLELHRWLVRLRPDELTWRGPPDERELKEEARERLEERDRVRDELLAGAEAGSPPWLLAQLLDYHRRESRPQWWAYFHNKELDEEELIDSSETLGGLELAGEPEQVKQSLVYTFTFPPQEHKIGGEAVDPATEQKYSVSISDEHGTVTLRRGKKLRDEPLPRALIPPKPLPTWVQRDAVLRFAKHQGAYPALVDVLERRPPRAWLDGSLEEAALSLDSSYLFVQGPPGSGKTWRGARLAIALMQAGHRVGVTALSHKAIHKFLEDLEEAADEVGYSFGGLKKSGGSDGSRYEGRGIVESTESREEMLADDVQFLAGTSFLFAREEFDQHLDVLFIDEGGQYALADAIAVGTAARNLVLLGDPNQLPQVSQAAHPPGANASVLEHLLGDEHETVPEEMGIFLRETWRLRPEICAFTSSAFYEGRLEPAEPARRRSLELGNGIRYLPVEHGGHRSAAPEEADVICREVERLVGTGFIDADGVERPLRYEDIKVVAPFNAHVRCLREALPAAVQVGTVDKFQGQECVVSLYSMASSSADEVPRGLEFLFSRNRLNVAISRAQCLAYLVASPRLLDANCRTVEQMRLANALCRLVEYADRADRPRRARARM
jgi:predicted RecB family nuclease